MQETSRFHLTKRGIADEIALDWAGRKIRYLLRLPEIQLVRNVRETNNVCRLMETEENESKAREDTPVENNNIIRNMRQVVEFE